MRVLVRAGRGTSAAASSKSSSARVTRRSCTTASTKGHREAVHRSGVRARRSVRCGPAARRAGEDGRGDPHGRRCAGRGIGPGPAKYYRNNVVAGLALLRFDARAGGALAGVFFVRAVYGEPAKQPIEESDPKAPTNPYGETKLAFEKRAPLVLLGLRVAIDQPALLQRGGRHRPLPRAPRSGDALDPGGASGCPGPDPAVTVFGTDYPTPDGTCVRDLTSTSAIRACPRARAGKPSPPATQAARTTWAAAARVTRSSR